VLEEEEETHLREDHQEEEASEASHQEVHQEEALLEEGVMVNLEETHQENSMGIAPKPTPSETNSTFTISPTSMQNK